MFQTTDLGGPGEVRRRSDISCRVCARDARSPCSDPASRISNNGRASLHRLASHPILRYLQRSSDWRFECVHIHTLK